MNLNWLACSNSLHSRKKEKEKKRCRCYPLPPARQASLVAQTVKNLPAMHKTWVRSQDREDPLEKEMATHSSIFAWRIPQTEEPGGLQPLDSQRDKHDWATNIFTPPPQNVIPFTVIQQLLLECLLNSDCCPKCKFIQPLFIIQKDEFTIFFFFLKLRDRMRLWKWNGRIATVTFGSAITGFLSTLNPFGANSPVPSFLLVVSLCSCHCLLTPPVRTSQGKWQEPGHGPWSRCRAERKQEEAENRNRRGVSCRGRPWTAIFPELITEWMKHTPPLPPLDLSTHQLNTSHTFRWLPRPVISLRPIFLLFRGRDSACCLLFKLEEFRHDFLSSVVEWLFELCVSLLSWISNQLGHMAIGRCLSLHMMDM